MSNRNRQIRRGVVLLIVLGMLAMFGLIGVTFILLSGHARRSAQAQAKVGRNDNPPDRIADDVLKQILRGSTDRASVIGPHSLLEDIYGNGFGEGQLAVAPAQVVGGGQLLSFTPVPHATSTNPIAPPYERYIGCVLTMANGPAADKSTRILGYNATQGFQVLAFEDIPSADLIADIPTYVANYGPISYVINGTPFSGTGFGYNSAATGTDPLLNATDPQRTATTAGNLLALLPNPRAFTPLSQYPATPPLTQGAYEDPAGPGGANEDYDAADYQNMLLACVVPQPGGAAPIIPIPSLHRPSLVNYWFHQMENMPLPWPEEIMIDPTKKIPAIINPNAQADGSPWTWTGTNERDFKAAIAALKRRFIMRPLHDDHPNFTGSNPRATAAMPDVFGILDLDGDGNPDCPWDVDNDGDGVMDSIWVDVGLPVRTTSDGRQYKPLAAILCLDMDGRLNLNAHGCLAQTSYPRNPTTMATFSTDPKSTFLVEDPATHQVTTNYADGTRNLLPIAAGQNSDLTTIPHGQGVGPAEISLLPVLNDNMQLYRNLLLGEVGSTVLGRYGEAVINEYNLPCVGSINGVINPLSTNKWFEYPASYDPATTVGTRSYGTPLDFQGSVTVGLDLRGQPLYLPTNAYAVNLISDGALPRRASQLVSNPYDLNLSDTGRGVTSGSSDTPFAPSELEAVLRPYDIDTNMLPGRLTTLAPDLAQHRYEVTTESWSLPCPAVSIPPELRDNASVQGWISNIKASSLADLMRAKLVEADSKEATPFFTVPSNLGQINALETLVSALLPSEMRAGLKMDLNRPFGNGIDDNIVGDPGYGVIDEPGRVVDDGGGGFKIDTTYHGETTDSGGTLEEFYQCNSNGGSLSGITFNHCNNVDVNSDGNLNTADCAMARQLYARNLYVMMLLLLNHDGDADVAREVAQWAVNVVDFRDRDSIMTAFEYDTKPFTDDDSGDPNEIPGVWDVDGVIDDKAGNVTSPDDSSSYRGLVWGCERPEVLITETLAFHDRRTQNTSAGGGMVGSGTDTDFDQQYRPEGSLFVELHNPWTDKESLPNELCETVDGHKGIYLRKKASDDESPVWRMIIVDKTNTDDPDDPTLASPVPIERSVYFIEPGTNFVTAMGTTDGERFYPDPNNTLPELSVLKPGRYAVIGPGKGTATSYTTYVGFRDGVPIPKPPEKIEEYNDPQNQTRRIVLTPSTDADTQQVEVYGDGEVDDLASLDIQSAIAVVINPEPFGGNATKPQRLSVSEPVGGYPACPGPGETYFPAQFQPLDKDDTAKMATGTTSQYRWIYLQRLANPLQPYDEHSNPYRSIDKAQVDLTAFNGMADDTADQIVTTATAATPDLAFFTRERGEDEESQATDPNKPNNIWAVELSDDEPKAIDAHKVLPAQTHRFNEKFAHTLGYLNEGFGEPQADPRKAASGITIYDGRPNTPFPWLTWLNRPFLSEMEMMLVPKQRSSQLLNKDPADADKDKFFYPTASFSAANPYEDPGPNADQVYEPSQPYGHLINFFYDDTDPTGNPNRKLHRLLEFVRVPSPFVGTQLQGDPTAFSMGTHDFHPPFNRISERRDPGRVNLNTIASEEVWRGVLGDYFDPAATPPQWNNLVQSRRGDGVANMFDLNPTLPTRFANPFRSYAGYYDVPHLPNTPPNPPQNVLQDIIGSEVNATMLRPMPGGSNAPLFNHNPSVDSPVNNTDRNPAFRYQLFNRLGSTATTRSNVYGVWITVGYFEVEPATWEEDPANPGYDKFGRTEAQFQAQLPNIYPDGYRLGQELGSDTGDITRHRSFYMIDRSIPVGFKRGEDLNTEDAVILRRFIE